MRVGAEGFETGNKWNGGGGCGDELHIIFGMWDALARVCRANGLVGLMVKQADQIDKMR